MSSLKNYDERKWYSFNASELFKAFIIAAIILLITFAIADGTWPRRYYVSDIQVCNVTIAEKQQEESKFYIRVNNAGISAPISADKLWFEVKPDFYVKYNTNSSVGITLSKCDSYKKNLFDGGRSFEASSWEVQDIYGSYEEAQQANQYKKYSAEAVIEMKKKTETGIKLLILKADDRSYSLEVDEKTFNDHSENQKVKCTFESVGEFVKLISVDG